MNIKTNKEIKFNLNLLLNTYSKEKSILKKNKLKNSDFHNQILENKNRLIKNKLENSVYLNQTEYNSRKNEYFLKSHMSIRNQLKSKKPCGRVNKTIFPGSNNLENFAFINTRKFNDLKSKQNYTNNINFNSKNFTENVITKFRNNFNIPLENIDTFKSKMVDKASNLLLESSQLRKVINSVKKNNNFHANYSTKIKVKLNTTYEEKYNSLNDIRNIKAKNSNTKSSGLEKNYKNYRTNYYKNDQDCMNSKNLKPKRIEINKKSSEFNKLPNFVCEYYCCKNIPGFKVKIENSSKRNVCFSNLLKTFNINKISLKN